MFKLLDLYALINFGGSGQGWPMVKVVGFLTIGIRARRYSPLSI